LLNVKFDRDMDGLASAGPIQGPPPLIDHDAVKRAMGGLI